MQNKPINILLIDDDHDFLQSVKEGIGEVYNIFIIDSIDKALPRLKEYPIDLIILDLVFDGKLAGLEFITELQKDYDKIPIIAISKEVNDGNFVDAIKRGAGHFFRKEETDFTKWHFFINKIYKEHQLKKESILSRNEDKNGNVIFNKEIKKSVKTVATPYKFIGQSPRIVEIKEELEALGQEPDISVLLLGETGVGKEVAAHYLHTIGIRSNKPFQAVNLSSVSDSLMESLLFGHKKGAFTGALKDQVGIFQKADKGILFLDEIGDINLDIQVKLLRFLQDKIITPVGSEKDIKLDVQIIAATNKNLDQAIEDGTFRLDLFHRLNDFSITIPPLRERKEDIPLLAEYYLNQRGEKKEVLSDDIWEWMQNYYWPGNIRELVKLMKNLLVKKKIKKVAQLDLSFLPSELLAAKSSPIVETITLPDQALGSNNEEALAKQTARLELSRIEEVLRDFKRKSIVVEKLDFENLDQLRYRVKKHYKEYPSLFKDFPIICKKYKLEPNN